jgi:hypothetical protein
LNVAGWLDVTAAANVVIASYDALYVSPGGAHATVYALTAAAQAGQAVAQAAASPTADGQPEQAPPSEVAVVSVSYACVQTPSDVPGLGGGIGSGGGGLGRGGGGGGGEGGGGLGGLGGGGGHGFRALFVEL